MGRPKRNSERLTEHVSAVEQRRARLAPRIGGISPEIVGNTVWRIKRRPV
jgi:hypothetical protein